MPVGVHGDPSVLRDEIGVDRRRGGQASCGGHDHLGAYVRHIAGDPHTRHGGGAGRVGGDLGADDVPTDLHVNWLEPE
jgi:hypothetical protein